MKLTGNTILITGGASGIGLALTRHLSALPNRVIVCGRNRARLAALQADLPNVQTYPCDLSDEASLGRFVDQVVIAHPDLNVLINNAGVQDNQAFDGNPVDPSRVRVEIDTNLLAPITLSGRLLPHLMQQEQAAIINITSALAFAPKKSAAVYSATKAALRSFSQALRDQLRGSPVSVYEVVPSLVETEMTRDRVASMISPEQLVKQVLVALGRDRQEILIGKTRLLYLLNRLSPAFARYIVSHA
ncbi:MAG: SDR family NAD(P)-dependent oxidoreductase [Candidatus Thiodiazotropha sp.]